MIEAVESTVAQTGIVCESLKSWQSPAQSAFWMCNSSNKGSIIVVVRLVGYLGLYECGRFATFWWIRELWPGIQRHRWTDTQAVTKNGSSEVRGV